MDLMHSKKSVASLSITTIVLTVACIYFVLYANFDNPSYEIAKSKVTKTPLLVLGKELQSVIGNLAENVLISVRTTSAYHKSRLSVLLLTWMQSVPRNQVDKLELFYKFLTLTTKCHIRWLPQ